MIALPHTRRFSVFVLLMFVFAASLQAQGQEDKTSHNAGNLLVQKEKYSVYENAHWTNSSRRSTCVGDSMYLVVVYDIAPNDSVDMSLEEFFGEIQPATTKLKCIYNYYVQKSYNKWTSKDYFIDIYLKNSWFAMDKDKRYQVEYQSAADLKGEEIPFMRLTISDYAPMWEKSKWSLNKGYGDSYFKEHGSPANWSLSNARKIIADQKSKDEYERSPAVIAAKAAEAEKLRIANAEAAEKRRIAYETKRREDNLAKAADVFRFYKKNAPAIYDFSGYANQNLFQNIYAGKFDPFTGGYTTRESWVSSTVHSGFGNADVRNPFGFLLNLMETTANASDIRGRRDALDGVFYAYHLVYKEQCYSNKEMPWDVSALMFYLTRNGVTVEGSETKGNVYLVRKPFLKTFNGSYGNLGSTTNLSPSVPESLTNDFRRFLKTEGCASSTTRYFETNLYLATEWMPPLQQLQEFIQVEKPKTELETPKVTTPQNEKVKPKTRRKRP